MNQRRDRIFCLIAKFSCTHWQRLILAALLGGAFSSFLITRLQFQSDVLHLLPKNAPRTEAFVRFLKDFGAADSLFIVLERKKGGEMEPLRPFAEALVDRLLDTGEFREITGRMDSELRRKIARQFLRKVLLYLPEEDLKTLKARLSDREIEEQIRSLKSRLSSLLVSPLAPYDPLALFPLFQKNLPLSPFGGEADSGGYFLSPDGKMILIIGKPRGSAPDLAYDERLVQKIRAAENSTRGVFIREKDAALASMLQELEVGLTGGFIHALEDRQMIKKELLLNFSVSWVGVLLITVLAFRAGISLLYAFFPLLISPLLTLGLFSPFLDRLSESTGAFSAIIVGLSIDFIILLYSRYLEEKNLGMEVPRALERSLKGVGPGIFTGAITTTAAYYALLLSDFRGVQELGLLTGTGILVSLACALFIFPALVAWRETKKPRDVSDGPMSSFWGLERLSVLSLRRPLIFVIPGAAVTLLLIPWLLQVKLNNDPRRLRPEGHSSMALEMKVQEKMGEGLEKIILLTQTQRPEEALELQGRLKRIIEKAQSEGLPIARYENLASFLPPLSQQKKNLEWLEKQERGAFDLRRVEKKLRESLLAEGFRIEPFESGLLILREMLSSREPLTWEEFEASPLRSIGEKFLKKGGGAFFSVAYLHVRPTFWADPREGEFLESLRKVHPGLQITGPKLLQRELEEKMAGEAWKVLLVALAAVALLIYLDFRSFSLTFLSLLPVTGAALWTLGFMGMLKIELNFMNLIVFTMVLGIGVDYGIHILHRALESTAETLKKELIQVSRGVLLAALTTLAAFGSLALSSYPGLRSMGGVALMGVGFSLLITLILVPAFLQKLLPKRGGF